MLNRMPHHMIRIKAAPILLGFSLLAILLTAGCNGGDDSDELSGVIEVGAKAPDFTLANIDGTTVSLKDYKGKQPVLLFFHMAVG